MKKKTRGKEAKVKRFRRYIKSASILLADRWETFPLRLRPHESECFWNRIYFSQESVVLPFYLQRFLFTIFTKGRMQSFLLVQAPRTSRRAVILLPLRPSSLTHKSCQRRKIVQGMRPVWCKDRCSQTSPSRHFPANPYRKRLVLPPVLAVVFEVFFDLSKPRSAPFQILKIFESVQPGPPKK